MRKKNRMIISTEALLPSLQKAFNKTQYPFLLKTHGKPGIRRFSSVRFWASAKNLWLTSQTKCFYSKIRNKTRMCSLITAIHSCTGDSSRGNQARKKIKGNQFGKEEVKPTLFTNDWIVYVKNMMESTKMLPELVSYLSKVRRYSIHCISVY